MADRKIAVNHHEHLSHLQSLIIRRDGELASIEAYPRGTARHRERLIEIRSLNDQILRLTIIEQSLGKWHGKPDIKTPIQT